MLFFVCIFIYLLYYKCDGHATIFTFNLNSFHVHVLTYIVLPSSSLFVHCCQIYFLCMLIWAKMKWLIDWINYRHFSSHCFCLSFCSISKLISAGLPSCSIWLTISSLWQARLRGFSKHTSLFFWVRQGVSQESVLFLFFLSLFINNLLTYLATSFSCFFYADNLAIWSFSPSGTAAEEATQWAPIRLQRWSEHWCLPLNSSKCDATFLLVDPHQANLHLHFCLFNSPFCFNRTPAFFGSHLTALFPFLHVYLCLRPFLVSRSYAASLLAHGVPPRSPLLFFTKLFSDPFLQMLHPNGFHFSALTTFPSWNTFTERTIAHHRLPLLFPYASFTHWGIPTSSMSQPDLFRPLLL